MSMYSSRFTQGRKEAFMRRALELAANGRPYASPNPMVGAVIVDGSGRVIGEGWHRRCGQGHAEVNAVASVKDADRHLLREATMFVTLEPCSHYGKTPPCARMIVEKRIPHVVVAMVDDNPRVSGRGIAILREAGVEVEVGVLEDDARALNRKFLTSMRRGYPFITLKFARSADGFMDWHRTTEHRQACRFSTPLTSISTMKLRAEHDAVLTTSATVLADNPRLTLRGFDGMPPKVFIMEGNRRLGAVASDGSPLHLFGDETRVPVVYRKADFPSVRSVFEDMQRSHGVSSVLVEAGPTMLGLLIENQLWDDIREEVSPVVLGQEGSVHAPVISSAYLVGEETVAPSHFLRYYSRGI